MKRTLSLALALLMLLCAMPALTMPGLAEPNFVITNDFTLPVVDEAVTYTMLSETAFEFEGAGMKTLADGAAYKEWFKRTNVYLDIIPTAMNGFSDAYNIMLTSQDYPDIVNLATGTTLYKGGLDAAIEDGVYLRLNELVEEYMPHYWALINTDDETRRQAFTPAGNLKGLMNVWIPAQHNWYGPVVRQDWLDDLGMEMPETYDEWHEMLMRFKNEKGATAPLMLPSDGMVSTGMGASHLANGFGTCDSFYVDDNGKVQWGPVSEGYRKYVETMAQWYAEGLIDTDFYARNSNFLMDTSLTTTGAAGVWMEMYTVIDDRTLQSDDPNYHLAPIPDPVENKGDKISIWRTSGYINGPTWYVTTACKDPVPLLKALDYLYTDEGYHLSQYGFEGESYEVVDGRTQFSAAVYDNPNMSRASALFYYTLKGAPTIYVYHKEKIQMSEDAFNAPEVWDSNITEDSAVYSSFAQMSTEESEEFYAIFDDLNTYVKENLVNFIKGSRPLSEYDDYLKQCYAMGAEELIAIKQQALDRYMAS